MRKANSFTELAVYQAAYRLQQAIFEKSKQWPNDEKFSLTDQVRRSARSIGANLAEAWARRRYPAHFLSKLTDADGELQETVHWLNTSRDSGYLTATEYLDLNGQALAAGRQLGSMINRHESFCF